MSITQRGSPLLSARSGREGGSTTVHSEVRESDRAPRSQATVKGSLPPQPPVTTVHSWEDGGAVPASFPGASSPARTRVAERIGEGGMGVVAAAMDTVLLRRLARKAMRSSAGSDSGAARRFVEEAQITAQLDHPNIVPVHDLGVDDNGRLFFTMKLVDGKTFAKVLDELHQNALTGLELERVLRIFLKVCDAVAFAHSRGVVHRDLKPDNVMVGSHGQVYVMDWGIAMLLEGKRTSPDPSQQPVSVAPRDPGSPAVANEKPGSVLGTISYMAPEQAHGLVEEQGIWTDVFGLGAILYHVLTGRGPNAAATYSETVRRAKMGDVPDLAGASAWPGLPPGLCRITMKALSAMPRERHASVEELRREVEEFLRGGGWFQTRAYEAGDIIVHEGADADAAYIVTAGTCEVYRSVDGVKRVVRQVGEGEIFGEMGLLTQSPRVASVVATTRVKVVVLTPDALDRELDRKGWMRILVEALATRFREADQADADTDSRQ